MTSWNSLNRQIENCQQCPRLLEHCQQVATQKRRAYANWDYWGRPVPNFVSSAALKSKSRIAAPRMLIVGLAPAAHGANRTGRMFTGDRSGDWLFRAMHKAGFANQENCESADDSLKLNDCVITAICHCAPPQNIPSREEINACRPWLVATIDAAPFQVFLALGQIAWKGILAELVERKWHHGKKPKFSHGAQVELSGRRWLLGSYHPSQQNTFTGRLTEPMFDDLFQTAKMLLEK